MLAFMFGMAALIIFDYSPDVREML